MVVNVKNILLAVQKKANAIDANSRPIDILNVLKAIKQVDGSAISSYDSDGSLSSSSMKFAYVKNTGKVKNKKEENWQDTEVIARLSSYKSHAQGDINGYVSVNHSPIGDTIDEYSFSADGNATSVGSLNSARYRGTSSSSSTHGYQSAGQSTVQINTIDKFSFSSYTASSVGTMVNETRGIEAAGLTGIDYGYDAGGRYSPNTSLPYGSGPGYVSSAYAKYPFASDGNAAISGAMTFWRFDLTGLSSKENGYWALGSASGSTSGPLSDYWGDGLRSIERFPFASDTNIAIIGWTSPIYASSGYSKSFSAYTDGYIDDLFEIGKFSYASENKTAVLTTPHTTPTLNARYTSTTTSDVSGYRHVGYTAPTHPGGAISYNLIQKFPFAVENEEVDVGQMTVAAYYTMGNQV